MENHRKITDEEDGDQRKTTFSKKKEKLKKINQLLGSETKIMDVKVDRKMAIWRQQEQWREGNQWKGQRGVCGVQERCDNRLKEGRL